MDQSSEHSHPPFFKPLIVSVAFILTILIWSNFEEYETEGHQKQPAPQNESSDTVNTEVETSHVESLDKKKVVGFWEDNHHGKRYLTINSDGSGQMFCRMKGVAAFMVGNEFQLNIKWNIIDGYAVFETVGGSPNSSVSAVNSLWGAKQKQKILDLSKDQVQLLDMDGETIYNWKRIDKVPEDAQVKPETNTT